MKLQTIRCAVRQSLLVKPGVEWKQGRGRFVDPDLLQQRRQLERECERLAAELIILEQEKDEAVDINSRLVQRIDHLSDGFFGAEALVNRSELRDLRRQQEIAEQEVEELFTEIRERRRRLENCQLLLEEIGDLI